MSVPRDVGTPTIRQPNNSNTNRRTTRRTPTTGTRANDATNRYKPRTTKTDWSNARHIRDITTRKPVKPGSRVSDRYTPRDRVGTRTGTRSTGTRSTGTRNIGNRDARSGKNTRAIKSPRSTGRSDARSTNRPTTRRDTNRAPSVAPRVPTTPIVTPTNTTNKGAVTPNLVPRLSAPRLAAPRTSPWGRSSYSFRTRGLGPWGCRNTLFAGFWGRNWGLGWNNGWGFNGGWGWNNCGLNNWNFGYGGLTYWGGDPFYWNFGACSPYQAFRLNYWNSCYWNTYWAGWPIRGALPSNYWWYPSTSYCPTFLYVPSSVVYEEELEPIDGGGDYYPVEEARGEATPDDAGTIDDTKSTPESLAKGYVELGDFYFKANRFDVAAEAYAKARNHVPNDASVHFVLADAVFANGDYHYAAFLISEAVRLDPSIVTADVDKRDYYGDKKTFEAQMEALQKYCDEKPYDAWAQLVLGYNARFSDQPTRAVAAFRRVLELDRDNPTARAFLADLVPALKTGPDGKKAAGKATSKPGVK